MAFGSVGTIGTGTDNTSDTSLVMTTSATVEAGNVIVLLITADNFSGTDGDQNEVASVVDSAGGNVWNDAVERTNGQTGAGTGVTNGIWWCKLATQLDSGGTITITFNNAISAKVCTGWEFTIGSGKTMQITGTPAVSLNDGVSDPGDLVVGSLANTEHLFIANDGHERAGITYTKDASNTAFSGATAGSGLGGVQGEGSFRIVTATSDGNDCSYSTGCDGAQIYVAFDEVDEAGGTAIPLVPRTRYLQGLLVR